MQLLEQVDTGVFTINTSVGVLVGRLLPGSSVHVGTTKVAVSPGVNVGDGNTSGTGVSDGTNTVGGMDVSVGGSTVSAGGLAVAVGGSGQYSPAAHDGWSMKNTATPTKINAATNPNKIFIFLLFNLILT
jgi:hypothetical protein